MMQRLPSTSIAAVVLVAACQREITRPHTLPGGVEWVEWPVAVSIDQPGTILVRVAPECPQYTAPGVAVNGSAIHVTSTVDFSRDCATPPPTVLALPVLASPSGAMPATFTIHAPVVDLTYVGPFTTYDRVLGEIELRTSPDTTRLFAGVAFVYRDSVGCWRAIPQRSPQPRWTFAKPLPLAPETTGRVAFLRGRLIPAAPPVCGDSLVVDVLALEVSAAP